MSLTELFADVFNNYEAERARDPRTNSPYFAALRDRLHGEFGPIAAEHGFTIDAPGGKGTVPVNPHVAFRAPGHKISKGFTAMFCPQISDKTIRLFLCEPQLHPASQVLLGQIRKRIRELLPSYQLSDSDRVFLDIDFSSFNEQNFNSALRELLTTYTQCLEELSDEIDAYLATDDEPEELQTGPTPSPEQIKAILEDFYAWYEQDEHEQKEIIPEYQNFTADFFKSISDTDLAELMHRFAREGGQIQSGGERTAGRLKESILDNATLFRSQTLSLFNSNPDLRAWWTAMDSIKFFGKGIRSIYLHRLFPDRCGILNQKSLKAFEILGLLTKSGSELYDQLTAVTDAAKKLVELDPLRLNLYKADAFCHYLIGTDEGRERYKRTMKISPAASQRYWVISCGRNGELSQQCLEQSIISIGWNDLGDLTRFKSREELATELHRVYPKEGTADDQELAQTNSSLACYQFAQEMRIGDYVILKQGTTLLHAIGQVTSDYTFHPGRANHQHIRQVSWQHTGQRSLSDTKLPLKTLTDISRNRQLIDKLVSCYGDTAEQLRSAAPGYSNQSRNYWWLNAKSSIWTFASFGVGGIQSYTSHNEKGNKRRVYSYFQQAKPGDLVMGYQSSPDCEVVAVCEVTKPLSIVNDQEVLEFRITEILDSPISLSSLQAIPDLKEAEPLINNQGSLFKLRPAEYEIIRAIIDDQAPLPATSSATPFTKAQAMSQLFMDETQLDSTLFALHHKKNIVLQGPPGVGKTFAARLIAWTLLGEADPSRVQMIQFHQSYSYEDFIQGYRPTPSGHFELKNGPFYDFCRRAARNPNQPYVFIIDEINRGNLSKIFGELMLLIEHDKRGPACALPLMYSANREDTFYIPENLYLIGSMNTADRSLAMVDYALRRRFAFIDLKPEFESAAFKAHLLAKGAPAPLCQKIINRIVTLNQQILEDNKDLGPGYQIGHSYFCPNGDTHPLDEEWFKQIIQLEVAPLLREYWFDKEELLNGAIDTLLA